MTEGSRVCNRCGRGEPEVRFKSKTLRCAKCCDEIWEEGQRAKGLDPNKVRADKKAMRRALKRNGLTAADLPVKPEWHVNRERAKARTDHYARQRVKQSGLCAICVTPGRVITRDHCHGSGDWRGLLCRHCNTALGLFRESLDLLRRAREYLVFYAGRVHDLPNFEGDKPATHSHDLYCEICDRPETYTRLGTTARLARDHCHTSGKARGLLCVRCNRGLGAFQDSVSLLRSASLYLIEWGRTEGMGEAITGPVGAANLTNSPPNPEWGTDLLQPTDTTAERGRRRFTVPGEAEYSCWTPERRRAQAEKTNLSRDPATGRVATTRPAAGEAPGGKQ